MKTILTTIFTIFLFININAQPYIASQKTYGGSAHEYAWKTIPTSDGGYAFVGECESNNFDVSGNHGGVDLWVAKISSTGVIQWSYLFGGTEDDYGKDIIQTSDGGFIVAGYSYSVDGDVTGHHGTNNYDFWVLKLTSAGSLTWNKCYGGTYDDKANSIVQNISGDYYIAGTTDSNNGDVSGIHGSNTDFWIIKTNSSGTLLSQKCIGGTNYEECESLTSTLDNGCIAVGRTASSDGDAIGYHGGNDMLITKLNSSLVVEWSKCYGGSETEECNAIVQLNDGSYTALGYSSTGNNGDVTGHHSPQGADDFWLLKLTSTGVITWAKCYGGSGDDQANGLTKTSDGGFVMCGLTNSTDGDVTGFHASFFSPDIWVAKVNSEGTLLWQKCVGGSDQDESFNIFENGNDTYVVTGFTYSTDFDVTNNHGNADGWLIWIAGNTSVNENDYDSSIILFPNPTKDKIFLEYKNYKSFEVSIFSLNGEKIYFEKTNIGNTTIDLNNIEQGIYLLEIQTAFEKITKKIIKLQ